LQEKDIHIDLSLFSNVILICAMALAMPFS